MALREKFGRLVLLEQTDSSPLGNEYRAARLGPSGFDRLVTVLRFAPALSANAEACKRLVDEARLAAQIQNPGLLRVLGVGRVGPAFYLSSEVVEGRTLRDVLASCRDQGFPFTADHALMVASRAAAGLEALHARKDDAGRPLLHGLVSPRQLVVAFDGEVKLKGLGLWSALAGTELLALEECGYLAPEQATSRGDPRSDVYALGLVLLEALSGQGPDAADPQARIASATIARPGGEGGPLPRPLAELLQRALGRDPATRFPGMAELRRAVDTLLFSGDFTPTTFDLAFFMHTLFRDEVERDARAIEEARAGDYREFLSDEAAKAKPPSPAQTEPADAGAPEAGPTAALAAKPTELEATLPEPSRRGESLATPARPAPAAGPDSSGARRAARASREAGVRETVARLSAGGGQARPPVSRTLVLVLGLLAAVVLGGGAGWLYFVSQRRPAAAAQASSAEQAAAEARVHELEARIAQLEREKVEAESRAADEARRVVEKQAAAGGQPVDPKAVVRAQDEARRRARQEQEGRQQEEMQRLGEEKRAEEQRLAAATPVPAPVSTPTPATVVATPAPPAATPLAGGELVAAPAAAAAATTQPAAEAPQALPLATPTPAAQAAAGPAATGAAGPATPSPAPAQLQAADPADPAVRPPALVSEVPVPYPPSAISRRISATVVVRAYVDEQGRVAQAEVFQPSGQPAYGFDEAALKRVRSRRYRPARRHDVPVPIWVVVRVEFRPPPLR